MHISYTNLHIAMGSDTHTARRRAVSSATAEPNNGSCQTRGSSPSRHNRASSEFSVSKVFPSPPMSSSRNMTIQIRQKLPPRTIQDFSSKAIGQPISQESVSHKSPGKDISVRSPKNDKKSSKVDSKGSKAGGSSFLDMEESDADSSHRYSDDLPILQPSDDAILDPSKASGTTFDELVDRLLSQPMSKADMNFIEIFLCLYRKFAAPGMLLSAILARLEKTADDKSQHFLTRTSAQLRIVAVLTKWISTYPGDFASPHTSQQFNTFLEQISLEPAFNYAAHEMKNTLRSYVAEDDDTRWERTDPDVESDVDEIDESLGAMSLRSAANASKSTSHSSLIEERVDHRHSEVVSVSSGEVSMFSGRPSGLHTVADYEVEAATMVPCRKRPLTKIIYHSCMDISDDDFADEITRIDWVMFSSVRVRDLIRDVSLSSTKKARCRSLVNVSRAISHFNHVACWVTNMILMRDKAKHRARILEKFMRIAWKLRQLNNYNGLAAVMAGIQNTAVARLAQTQALISDDCRKQFMRLEILMGPRKSHFAYRLAWQNSPLPRIPYVPLSRRDLASAEEGSKTFIGSRINWAKFSLLGDVILPILATRGSSYDIPSKGVVRELILDSAIAVDDEELYARSLVLEQVGVLESKKRFFKW